MLAIWLDWLAIALGKIIALVTSADPAIRAPIAISLGAIPGALCRYYITTATAQWFGSSFPYGTFLINLTGAFVMGLFISWTFDRVIGSPELRLFVATGFLGSYTTFSTYTLETVNLFHNGKVGLSGVYWLGSAGLGLVCVELGSWVARRLP